MRKIACLMLVTMVSLFGVLMPVAVYAYEPTNADGSGYGGGGSSAAGIPGNSTGGGSGGGGGCEHTILGLRPWYSGLKMGDKCAIESPSEDEIPKFAWTIILNILADVFLIGGYLGVGFVVYGGFLYIMSAGDSGKMAKGKKVLTSAVIGLVIMILATVMVNFVISVLTEAAS